MLTQKGQRFAESLCKQARIQAQSKDAAVHLREQPIHKMTAIQKQPTKQLWAFDVDTVGALAAVMCKGVHEPRAC